MPSNLEKLTEKLRGELAGTGKHRTPKMRPSEIVALQKLLNDITSLTTSHITIAVITALPKERAAFAIMMDDPEPQYVNDQTLQYELGKLHSPKDNQPHWVLLAQAFKMGNNGAAITATHLMDNYPHVRDILMVGIAGGIPRKEFKPGDAVQLHLGDIVVSRDAGVIQYDMVTAAPEKSTMRGAAPLPSARLLSAVDKLEADRIQGKRPWENYINYGEKLEHGSRPPDDTDPLKNLPADSTRRAGMPKVHYGAIGSANTLLKDPTQRDILRKTFKIIAVEMEGSGIADATWVAQAGYLLIRGICDYCDIEKDDLWQGYAAVVAAAYARSLIESLAPSSP
jgi:nucleoside phosphorylase